MYTKCKEGKHPLREVSRTSDGFVDRVVRWCPKCGAIVIDMESDGRTYPGRYLAMQLSDAGKKIVYNNVEDCHEK
jgi:hypothetical protein